MYDQRWSEDWIVQEHHAPYKDAIFDDILDALARRLPPARRRLLDVGAHAGRFLARARRAGWYADGLELNPATAAFASAASGGRVHQGNMLHVHSGRRDVRRLTLTDVLEHVPEPGSSCGRLLVACRWRLDCDQGAKRARTAGQGACSIARLLRGYRPSLADNLVHVNHFSPVSLRMALEREGFRDVAICVAAPGDAGRRRRQRQSIARCAVWRSVPSRAMPGGSRTPLAFNLQAYGRRV